MMEWAKQAGKLVFQNVETLHEDNIVTFCVLALFWYGQGSWRFSYLYKGTSILNPTLLVLPKAFHKYLISLLHNQQTPVTCSVSGALNSRRHKPRVHWNLKYGVVACGLVI